MVSVKAVQWLMLTYLVAAIDISDRYIITLHPSADLPAHLDQVQHLHIQSQLQTRDDGERVFDGLTHNYTIATFKGYAGHFSPSLIDQLQSHPDVKGIHKDAVLKHDSTLQRTGNNAPEPPQKCNRPEALEVDAVMDDDAKKPKFKEQVPAPLGLQIIGTNDTHRLAGGYWYDTRAGAGSWAYILDSGIDTFHAEWAGCFKLPRGLIGFNAVPGTSVYDVDGHGTMIMGIIGGNNYGVAKNVRMVAVKVFHKTSIVSWFLDGLKWTMQDIKKNGRTGKAVINVCLSGEYNEAFNDAVRAVVKEGVAVVVAAGNDARPVARNESPASAAGVIVVGATDFHRRIWKDSNTGPEVAIFAPGVGIESAYPGGRKATARGTGTSMAAPFVTGLIAYLRSIVDLSSPKAARQHLLDVAVKDVVSGQLKGSANLYGYNDNGR